MKLIYIQNASNDSSFSIFECIPTWNCTNVTILGNNNSVSNQLFGVSRCSFNAVSLSTHNTRKKITCIIHYCEITLKNRIIHLIFYKNIDKYIECYCDKCVGLNYFFSYSESHWMKLIKRKEKQKYE